MGRGRGFERHLLALKWMLEDEGAEAEAEGKEEGIGIETPALFQDEGYKKIKPRKVITSNFTTG